MSNPYYSTRAINQFHADAKLLAEFEHCNINSPGNPFHYADSVKASPKPVPEEQIRAYLSKIQRGGHIQSFGCLLAVEESSFRVLAYSVNSFELLGLTTSQECLLGVDARTFFTKSSSESLEKALASTDLGSSNPTWVVSAYSQSPFSATLHRTDVGVVIDLEPEKQEESAFSVDGLVRLQKLALQETRRLQALPRGNISLLCDTMVKIIKELCGYDRVMVFKFHNDEHGEVVSESRSSDLEPYLGLHYPATDIPQAARFLYMKYRVRMIFDTSTDPVPIIQSEELKKPIILVSSILRAPHDCHLQYMANMGSMASFTISIVINENGNMKLWGLVSCHHPSPRHLPFPIRYACQFIMQAFGSQLSMELQLVLHIAEKKILKTEALLHDMVLKDVPFEIVAKPPNIMDLVNCNGAAFYFGGVCRVLGVAPSEQEIRSITEWLIARESDLTVWSTDSLVDVGYPNASALGSEVCGVAVARITSKDFLYWFRSHTGLRWEGPKHHDQVKDDWSAMHPRSSFNVFLDEVKNKSFPWEEWEINAIDSLQHSVHDSGSFHIIESDGSQMEVAQHNELQIDKSSVVAAEMVRLLETALAPIFAVDFNGNVTIWNSTIAELTGVPLKEAIGKSLVNELLHEKSPIDFGYHLSRAFQGEEEKNIELRLKSLAQNHKSDSVFIVANACSIKDHINNVVNVYFIGQDVTAAKSMKDKFICLQEDYKAARQSHTLVDPPIFVSDERVRCCEWNSSMEMLTGWGKNEVIGKMLPGEIFGRYCMADQDEVTKLVIFLYQALCEQDDEIKFPFAFLNRDGVHVQTILTANKRIDVRGNITGCICSSQSVLPDANQTSSGMSCSERFEDLEKNRQEIHSTSEEDICLELNLVGFHLKSVMNAVVSKVMTSLAETSIHLIQEMSEEIQTLPLCGDPVRFQQVLSNFLLNMMHHTPTPIGSIEIRVDQTLKTIHERTDNVQLQFRLIHSGPGLPVELVEDIFREKGHWSSQEGFDLNMSRNMLKKLNGDVQYVREPSKCYFLIGIEFQTVNGGTKEP